MVSLDPRPEALGIGRKPSPLVSTRGTLPRALVAACPARRSIGIWSTAVKNVFDTAPCARLPVKQRDSRVMKQSAVHERAPSRGINCFWAIEVRKILDSDGSVKSPLCEQNQRSTNTDTATCIPKHIYNTHRQKACSQHTPPKRGASHYFPRRYHDRERSN